MSVDLANRGEDDQFDILVLPNATTRETALFFVSATPGFRTWPFNKDFILDLLKFPHPASFPIEISFKTIFKVVIGPA